MSEFFQDAPRLGNQYDEDRVLRSYLLRRFGKEKLAAIEPGLRHLGGRAVTDIQQMGDIAEANPPKHVPYDPWGRRIDHIEVSDAWKRLDGVAAEEGIVATGYERKEGDLSRVHQFARIYLFNPPSAIYTCPLAMTDGAARAIELYGDEAMKQRAYKNLTSRDPQEFWTSGQWMTERTGGSDVGGTSTIAKKDGDGYRLYGTKWFTSATTSQMAMTLARIEGAPEGSRGLSLFYLELRDEQGRLDNITVHRLKDKLGTKALPTAELTLNGTRAVLVGGEGHGVRKIASLFNITRMYNACCAVSYMRRGLALARDYAGRRVAFGKRLSEQPAHVATLAELQVEYEAAFHLTFRLIELLGKDEMGTATEDESAILRLLTPIAKLYTGKQASASASEVLECFGGAGYVEDTGLPRLLRDSQVLSIWEGTTNVLALDTLRAIEKENAFGPFVKDMRERLRAISHPDLRDSAARVLEAVDRIEAWLPQALAGGLDSLQAGARAFAFSLARTYAASQLLDHAEWSLREEQDGRTAAVARRWCARDLAPLVTADDGHRAEDAALAMDRELSRR